MSSRLVLMVALVLVPQSLSLGPPVADGIRESDLYLLDRLLRTSDLVPNSLVHPAPVRYRDLIPFHRLLRIIRPDHLHLLQPVMTRLREVHPFLRDHMMEEDQNPAESAEPERRLPGMPVQPHPAYFQTPQQVTRGLPPTAPPVRYQVQEPQWMAVRCWEDGIRVELKQDRPGFRRILPDEVRLGGCPATEVDERAHVVVLESELRGCGSVVLMTERVFMYWFTLVYEPRALGDTGITRSQRSEVRVECHYPRHIRPGSKFTAGY